MVNFEGGRHRFPEVGCGKLWGRDAVSGKRVDAKRMWGRVESNDVSKRGKKVNFAPLTMPYSIEPETRGAGQQKRKLK